MFNFPVIERKPDFKFKNNLLQTVTFQVKYSSNASLVSEEDFWKKSLLKNYPNVRKLMQVKSAIQFEFPEKTPIIHPPKSKASGFEFRSQDSNKIITIAEDAFTFTVKGDAYSNFQTIYTQFDELFIPLLVEKGSNSYSRVAIRKINIIGFGVTEESTVADALPHFLNSSLVENFSFFPCNEYVDKNLIHSIYKNLPYQLNFIYGLLEKSAPEVSYRLLLDIDLFKANSETSSDEIRGVMKDINGEIFNIFNWSINENFLNSLKE